MKFLILFSCALAVASAGYASSIGYVTPYAHYGQHIPVIGPNGVPIETPEVQAAKASHLAAHAEESARNSHYSPVAYAPHFGPAYGAPLLAHNGAPLDTPEVEAAKALHFYAHAEATARNAYPHAAPYAAAAAGPIETPEVQIAKAAHFEAHAHARAHPYGHYRKRRGLAYTYPQHIPVIGPNGVPLDTPEVQAAKAHHFAAHAEAGAHASYAPVVAYGGPYDGHYGGGHYTGPLHYPVIGPNGVPVDTPEVQAARAHHFSAVAEATARDAFAGHGGHYGGHYEGHY